MYCIYNENVGFQLNVFVHVSENYTNNEGQDSVLFAVIIGRTGENLFLIADGDIR